MAIPIMKRQSKRITSQEDLEFLFNTNSHDSISTSFIMECFGDFDLRYEKYLRDKKIQDGCRDRF